MKKNLKWTLVLLLLISVNGEIWGSDGPLDRATLKGINGFMILVENIDPDTERDGLTELQIQNDAELKLRMAGIKVLTDMERLETKAQAYVYIRANILKLDRGSYVYNVDVSVEQPAFLKKDQSFATVSTWSKGNIGITPDLEDIRSEIKNRVDNFLNAWLSVNPKE